MKKIFCFLIISTLFISFSNSVYSQSILDRAKQKVKQRANNKVDKTMDKGLDEVEESTKVKKNEDGDTKVEEADGTKTKIEGDGDAKIKNANGTKEKGTTTATLSFNSKYDFVPGEKVVAYEDFNTAGIGDFPTRWNTNATAEVVTINNREGKWLKIAKEGVFHPEFITNLPENFTLEFDLGVNNDWNSNVLNLNIANLKSPDDFADYGSTITT
jgi:hypothetical protein